GVQPFRRMRGQGVAEFLHGLDCLRVDPTRWAGTGAERFNLPCPVNAGKRLGHLTAVRVLDADEYDFFHERISLERPSNPPLHPQYVLGLPWLRLLTSS